MVIEIESYSGNVFIFGKAASIGQLKNRMANILEQAGEKSFVSIFCARYSFDVLPYDERIEPDFCIDLDTHKVFKPQYDDSSRQPSGNGKSDSQ